MTLAADRRLLRARLPRGWSLGREGEERTRIFNQLRDAKEAARERLKNRGAGPALPRSEGQGWIVEVLYYGGRIARLEELRPGAMRLRYVDQRDSASWWVSHTALVDGAAAARPEPGTIAARGGLRYATEAEAQRVASELQEGRIPAAHGAEREPNGGDAEDD